MDREEMKRGAKLLWYSMGAKPCRYCGALLEFPELGCIECPNKAPVENLNEMAEAGWILRIEKVHGTGELVWLWMLCTEDGAKFRDDRDGHEWFEPDL